MESLLTYVLRPGESQPDGTLFQYLGEDGETVTVTHDQFRQDIRQAVGWLKKRNGSIAGKTIGMLAQNSYDYLVCYLGIIGAGGVAVLLNIEKSWEELQHEIDLAELDIIIHDGEYLDLEPAFGVRYGKRLVMLRDYRANEDRMDWNMDVEPDQLATLIFTSGTTGISKGVMLSNRNLYYGVDTTADYDKVSIQDPNDPEETFFACCPLYHIGGLIDVLSWIATGKKAVLNIEKKYFFRDLQTFKCEYVSIVPMMLETMRTFIRKGRAKYLGSVKKIMVGAAICEPELMQFFKDHGYQIYNGYGLTESTSTGLANFTQGNFESIGTVEKGVEVKLVNGEICMKGDPMLMGYYKNPEATAEALQDGWFHTGDLGEIDENGFVYLKGRKKNLIILASGENISPEELENLLYRNPAVTETIVKESGQKICAEIFCEEADQAQIETYITEMNRNIAMYKRITLVEFRSTPFPRTASGKIKR